MAIPPPAKRYTYQLFYCKYCGAKISRPIGSGKPCPSQCTMETRRRKVPTPHYWVYSAKLL